MPFAFTYTSHFSIITYPFTERFWVVLDANRDKNVVFPAPEGPIRATIYPGSIIPD